MRKVAFYLDSNIASNVDLSNILRANPGMGGSEHMILCIAYLLSMRVNGIEVLLYSKTKVELSGLPVVLVRNFDDVFKSIDFLSVDYLVVKHNSGLHTILKPYKGKTRFVIWCHNFVEGELSFYRDNINIARLITVGKEQMELYCDDMAFYKSDYIYNAISTDIDAKYQSKLSLFKNRGNNVVYIGSLIECKGFYYLARAWKDILKSVPDANLYVIGSGRLYDRSLRLGKWGIADEAYERKFMHFLLENGKLLPSVHFMGIMGEEKNDILINSKVGVPNPNGKTETVGCTAVEMQLMGCFVATKRCPGYLDTVKNGILYDSTTDLSKVVVELLKKEDNHYEETYEYIKNNFSFDVVIEEWELLFKSALPNDELLRNHSITTNRDYRLKGIKEKILKVKMRYPILSRIPSLEYLYWCMTKYPSRLINKLSTMSSLR